MEYFRLIDDMRITDRWHLGDVTDNGIDQKVALDIGNLLKVDLLEVEVTHDGRPLDYSVTAFNVPVVIERLAMQMKRIAGFDFQRVPALIIGAEGYNILNCTRRVQCLDEGRSEFLKWLPTDHRADLVGQYRSVTLLRIEPDLVPGDAHMFRVWGWMALVVSEKLKLAMEEVGCFGAKFLPV